MRLVQGQDRDAMIVSMGGNPSGRIQTLQLATWVSDLMQHCSTATQTGTADSNMHAISFNASKQQGSTALANVTQVPSQSSPAEPSTNSREQHAVRSDGGLLSLGAAVPDIAVGAGQRSRQDAPQHSPRHLRLTEVPSALWQGLPLGESACCAC